MKLIYPLLITLFLTACTASLDDYHQTAPKLSLSTYFSGPLIAWGLVQDYNDKVTRRFCVELNGTWNEQQGELQEKFYFDDGEISYRTWHLIQQSDGSFIGHADDVVGTASGTSSGYAFQWQYSLTLNIDGNNYEFFLDDWMYQLDEFRVFNRTSMRKFGIEVAQLTLFFDKQTPLRACR